METTEYPTVIKFFILESLSATEIHTKMLKVIKESAPSFPTLHRWILLLGFKFGLTSVEDIPRGERSKTATLEFIEQEHNIVLVTCEIP